MYKKFLYLIISMLVFSLVACMNNTNPKENKIKIYNAEKDVVEEVDRIVKTDEEWKELEMYLGMSQLGADTTGFRGPNVGSKLAGRADLWANGDLKNDAAFGESGFIALPAGYLPGSPGDYFGQNQCGHDNGYRGFQE